MPLTLLKLLELTLREKEQIPSAFMIHPDSRFTSFWQLFTILFVFYNAIVLPATIGFDLENSDIDVRLSLPCVRARNARIPDEVLSGVTEIRHFRRWVVLAGHPH